MNHRSFHPPVRSLMGPGPADVHPRVLAALARPTIGHLDPAFIDMLDELEGLLRAAFRTENALTLPVSAPGPAGMAACFIILVFALRAGLAALRLELPVPEPKRLPQLNAVSIPAGIDDAAVRTRLLGDYGLEIGAGPGPPAGRIWRIGLMGWSSRPHDVLFRIGALGAVLNDLGVHVDSGAALDQVQLVPASRRART